MKIIGIFEKNNSLRLKQEKISFVMILETYYIKLLIWLKKKKKNINSKNIGIYTYTFH